MWELTLLPILLFGWFALFRWALPAIGISTCLSGTCGSSVDPSAIDLKSRDGFDRIAGHESRIPVIELSGRVTPSDGAQRMEGLRR